MISTLTKVTPETLAEIKEEQDVRGTTETFLLFPLGSQFDHLIKQMLDRLGIYCVLADPASITASDVERLGPIGIILSGGPASVHADRPPFDEDIFDLGIPVLGICLGFQLWAHHILASVIPDANHEYGQHQIYHVGADDQLFAGVTDFTVLQSHGDAIDPDSFNDFGDILAYGTDGRSVAAGYSDNLWGVQFHPECAATTEGRQIFENFCFNICEAQDRFEATDLLDKEIEELRGKIGGKHGLMALSGGSDSAVAIYLGLAAGATFTAVYIKGVDRPDDEAYVIKYFGDMPGVDLKIVDATDNFLAALAGKTSPHGKRVAVREVYKPVLEHEASACKAQFICQGTLYTDISESGHGHASGARKDRIKLHHNVNLSFSLPEITPLDHDVKSTARLKGEALGVPLDLLYRHPFPGPGLVVRIEGVITRDKLAIAHRADEIWIAALREFDLYDTVWQAGATLTESMHTCTKGDGAAEGRLLLLWAVNSVDGFTAEWARLDPDFLDMVVKRLHNAIPELGAVSYRISNKPPSTIECG